MKENNNFISLTLHKHPTHGNIKVACTIYRSCGDTRKQPQQTDVWIHVCVDAKLLETCRTEYRIPVHYSIKISVHLQRWWTNCKVSAIWFPSWNSANARLRYKLEWNQFQVNNQSSEYGKRKLIPFTDAVNFTFTKYFNVNSIASQRDHHKLPMMSISSWARGKRFGELNASNASESTFVVLLPLISLLLK